MKIICKDNFNRDTVSDSLIAENLTAYWANRIARSLNQEDEGNHTVDFFFAVEDDYKLYKFEP